MNLQEKLQSVGADLQSTIEEREQLLDKADSEDRGLTEEEQEEFDNLKSTAEELRGRKEELEELIEERQELEGSINDPVKPQPETNNSGSVSAKPKEKNEFRGLGDFVQTIWEARRKNKWDSRLEERAQKAEDGSQGGFAIPDDQREEIMRLDQQEAVVRPRARVIGPGDSPDQKMTMPALDQTGTSASDVRSGVNVAWTQEDTKSNEQTMDLTEIEWDPKELTAHMVVTNKLLRNASQLEGLIRDLFQDAVSSEEDDKFLNGDGVGKPLGIIGHDSTHSVSRDTSDKVKYPDIKTMDEHFMGQEPVWVVHPDVISELQGIEDSNGNVIWHRNAQQGVPDMLHGYPVIRNQRSPQLGNLGDITLIDFSKYVVKDGFGPSIDVSEDNEFKSNNTVIKIVKDVDGKPWLKDTLTAEDGSFEMSPFVELQS